MQRRSVAQRVGAALLVGLLCAGCADDPEPEDVDTTSEPEPSSESPVETAVETPVAGSGADVDPADATAWCGAITPEQLAGLTGFEVEGVDDFGTGLTTCGGNLPGVDLRISWGGEPTRKSFEQLEASYAKPAGVYESSTVELDGGQEAVVALQPSVRTAFAGTVVDGRHTQVVVSAVAAQDADPAELGEMARQILAVYFD